MSEPYVGECRLVGFNFAPAGWTICNGQLLPISEYDTLFNLIGTTYGGDGQSTFGIPDLRGRVPIHQGAGPGFSFSIGQVGGVEQVTLNVQQIPTHSHSLVGSSANGNTNLLRGAVLAANPTQIYNALSPSPSAIMSPNSITNQGNNAQHSNLQPFLVMNWVISLFGIYPSQT
jgi:microcystin-dependent protein